MKRQALVRHLESHGCYLLRDRANGKYIRLLVMDAKDFSLVFSVLALVLAAYTAWQVYRRNLRWSRHFNTEVGNIPPVVDLKSLVMKLDETARHALESGLGLTVARADSEMRIEHLLLKLFENPDQDVYNFCQFHELSPTTIMARLFEAIDHFPAQTVSVPSFSQSLVDLLTKASTAASEFNSDVIRSGHLLFGLFSDNRLRKYIERVVPEFESVTGETVRTMLQTGPMNA